MNPRPVLVVGDIAVDVVALMAGPLAAASDSAARIRYAGGGAGANVAAWLASLGVPVLLAGRVGADAAGRQALGELAAAGVELAVATDSTEATGTVIVLVDADGERSMIPDRGANRALETTDLRADLVGRAGHLHLSGYPLLDERSSAAALAVLDLARRHGLTISLDPASVAPLVEFGPDRFLAATAGADLMLPNEAEARLLGGSSDPTEAALRLARSYGAVVVSCGAAGAVWATGETSGHVAAVATNVVDTTGAGDAFTAGLLARWRTGVPITECVSAALATAARAVTRLGARPTGRDKP